MNPSNSWRFLLLGALISILPVMIVFKLITLQTDPVTRQALIDQSKVFNSFPRTIIPARGLIMDRWGQVLASNQTVYEVGISLQFVKNPQTIAMAVSVVTGEDYETVLAKAKTPYSEDSIYYKLADYVTQEKVDRLQALMDEVSTNYSGNRDPNRPSLEGLEFTPHLARSYPEKDLASNILGFVSQDAKGYFGVEEQYDEILAGKSKTVWVSMDPNNVTVPPVVPDGASLILTIDRAIQAEMETMLEEAIDDTNSDSGTMVVYDPKTGEVLALASTPRMDLNDYKKFTELYDADTPFNRGVSQAYETGSVFKVLTMAAGLDSGAVKPETVFIDTGMFEIGGTYIYNWNGGAWGPQDMTGCLQHSLNVCLTWIAKETGTKNFYSYMNAFGMGHLTGVDMAGEVPGRLKVPGDSDWYDADLGTNSFGQGVSSTPLQMAMAVGAVANNGKMMAPHVVKSIINKGYQYDIEPRVIGMPIKAETAQTLTEMLANSLEIESSDALVTGYRVAGKTGTAQIPDPPRGYHPTDTNASFVGWGPVDDPSFVVYIWLERPGTSVWGSETAAPFFSEVVERLVVLMNLPPDEIRLALKNQP